jgi:acetyl-CoA carboxylase biotin carboxyl carrier protein
MADKKTSKPSAGASSKPLTTQTSLDVDALRKIVDLLEASEVSRLDWTNGDERLSIRRGPQSHVIHHAPPSGHAPGVHVIPTVHASVGQSAPEAKPIPPPAPSISKASDKVEKKGHVVTSPFVGTFYRTPSPDQPPFVEVGSQVKKGQVVCIVEAMKLMNEIEADTAGKIAEIMVPTGTPVEFGQALFRIEP